MAVHQVLIHVFELGLEILDLNQVDALVFTELRVLAAHLAEVRVHLLD